MLECNEAAERFSLYNIIMQLNKGLLLPQNSRISLPPWSQFFWLIAKTFGCCLGTGSGCSLGTEAQWKQSELILHQPFSGAVCAVYLINEHMNHMVAAMFYVQVQRKEEPQKKMFSKLRSSSVFKQVWCLPWAKLRSFLGWGLNQTNLDWLRLKFRCYCFALFKLWFPHSFFLKEQKSTYEL